MAGYSTKILNETENRGYSCREIQDVNKQVFLLLYACYKTNNDIIYRNFLKQKEVFKHPQERFGGNEVVIYLEDTDDMSVELIFNESDKRPPISTGAVPDEYAIRGIHHVELWLESFERTAALLAERMNYTLIAESSGRFRYGVEDTPGKFVDLLWIPETLRGLDGRGMVHHVAFSISGSRVVSCSRSRLPSRASRLMNTPNIWESRCNYLLNSKRRGNSSTSRSPLFSITHPNSC